ncbi:MAG: ACT domain-containing protein, partial [Victivallaceae bacterium]|nr:ACT domain-containing protein [Victivallaceae bacterium]
QSAARNFELPVLAENIEDDPRNRTRFWIIGDQSPEPSGHDKTTICFSLADRPGALLAALTPFEEEKLTLTMIESRPLRPGNWQYCFFVDLIGHRKDPAVERALRKLATLAGFIRVFGSYPEER